MLHHQLKSLRHRRLSCADYGVDLVVGGHSHGYERSQFVTDAYGRASSFSPVTNVVPQGTGNAVDPYKKLPGLTPHAGQVLFAHTPTMS